MRRPDHPIPSQGRCRDGRVTEIEAITPRGRATDDRRAHFHAAPLVKIWLAAWALLFWAAATTAQTPSVSRVEPPNWWAGLGQSQLELMVYGPDIADARVSVDYEGVRLVSQTSLGNPNYLFVTLEIRPDVRPGTLNLLFMRGGRTHTQLYELRAREDNTNRHRGFDASDVIYLMMPDRFANGDPSNDTVEGMLEAADRSVPRARHGGDFKGIAERLGYLDDLGVTAIWFTPVFENDMPARYGAYHGYAATDMYRVDRRFGSNAEYKALVDAAHARGMKVIMDMIHNHIGDHHWWMRDLPSDDWVHDLDTYGTTNYRGEAVSDPYVSDYDLTKMTKGWFVRDMPDLNQDNPWLARYLIQNTIWWIEYAGIDGIRMDTYPYPDKHYMAEWVKAVMEEYPAFNVVGETWVNSVAVNAYWQQGFQSGSGDGYESNLPSVTDFQIHNTLRRALTTPFGWTDGVAALHQLLTQDFLYPDPMRNVIFLDNHDTERFVSLVGEDVAKFKMALAYVLTLRGIPQVYYGTEILMSGLKHPGDANVRKDFPGGWPGDERDAFAREGRTALENEIFDYTRTLMRWRRQAAPVHSGRFMHFLPDDGTYAYFRYNEHGTVMVIMNGSDQAKDVNIRNFAERTEGFTGWRNVVTGETGGLGPTMTVPAWTTGVYELFK